MHPKPIKIASIRNLKEAWKNSRDAYGKGGAAGIDKITPAIFRERLETNLNTLREQLILGEFQFSPLKANLIEKGNGKFRVICVPTVADRLVQRLILRHLTFSRDHMGVLSEISFGAKDRGVHAAIKTAIQKRNRHPWVLKTDISQFFDQIPRNYLKSEIRKRVKAKSLIPLLYDVVGSEVKPKNINHAKEIKKSGIEIGKGLRQGMPLSPLLSNLVLNKFDKKLQRKHFEVIRYADDIICFCNNEAECLVAKQYIEQELKRIELSIPDLGDTNSKTIIHAPSEPVIFLGVEIYKQGSRYNKKIPQETWGRAIDKISRHGSIQFNLDNGYTLSNVLRRLKDIPSGYQSAFDGCTNAPSLVQLLKEHSEKTKLKLLAEIFGNEVIDSLSDDHRKFLEF